MSKLLFLLQSGLFIISIQFHSNMAGYESSEYMKNVFVLAFLIRNIVNIIKIIHYFTS